MSDFYDYLNGGGRQQPSLPIAHQRRPAPPSPPPKPTAANLINSANSRIEQAKQALYDKIDVCCAQYGLYGLQIIEQAVTQSLSVMINGGNPVAPQRQPQYAPPPPPPQYQQPPWGYNESYQQPQRQPANYEEAMADSFMNNLGAVMENCDREFDKKAEADMKQRLFEQKQYDMIAAQNRAMPPINIDEALAAHANDFEVTSEEDLRTNV